MNVLRPVIVDAVLLLLLLLVMLLLLFLAVGMVNDGVVCREVANLLLVGPRIVNFLSKRLAISVKMLNGY